MHCKKLASATHAKLPYGSRAILTWPKPSYPRSENSSHRQGSLADSDASARRSWASTGMTSRESTYRRMCTAYHDSAGSMLSTRTAQQRKTYPVCTGCLEYFPHALAEVAHQSYKGNQQHHADKPLHWDKSKSADESDALLRHQMEGDYVAVAWRALAQLERSILDAKER